MRSFGMAEMIERRIVDRGGCGRLIDERRIIERRVMDRWHATKPLPSAFVTRGLIHFGALQDISISGMSISLGRQREGFDQKTFGYCFFGAHDNGEKIECRLVRAHENVLGLRFLRDLSDARFASIVEACAAYSIQYHRNKIYFAGNLDNQQAMEHLLKCISKGATIDLSRARGGEAAAASMKLLRERGALFDRCNTQLGNALYASNSCNGCPNLSSHAGNASANPIFRLFPALGKFFS